MKIKVSNVKYSELERGYSEIHSIPAEVGEIVRNFKQHLVGMEF